MIFLHFLLYPLFKMQILILTQRMTDIFLLQHGINLQFFRQRKTFLRYLSWLAEKPSKIFITYLRRFKEKLIFIRIEYPCPYIVSAPVKSL